jgi:hypothetical protein
MMQQQIQIAWNLTQAWLLWSELLLLLTEFLIKKNLSLTWIEFQQGPPSALAEIL